MAITLLESKEWFLGPVGCSAPQQAKDSGLQCKVETPSLLRERQ